MDTPVMDTAPLAQVVPSFMNDTNESRVKLIGLINNLPTNVNTQVSCLRARANLLLIKKLSDQLRKDYLVIQKTLKEERKLIPKKVRIPRDPNAPKKPRAPRKKKIIDLSLLHVKEMGLTLVPADLSATMSEISPTHLE